MTDKKISVVYSKDGVSLKTADLTEDEGEEIQRAFDEGEHDPGKLRELIGLS